MRIRWALALVLAAGVLLAAVAAGCGSDGDDGVADPPSGESASGPHGKNFLASEVTGYDLVAGTQIRLQLEPDGRVVVNAGCNTMGGTAILDDGVFAVADVSMTEMGCDPALHAQDEWVADFITSDPAWEYAGDTLTLTGAAGTLVLVDREITDPDRPLEGTRWVVDTVVEGDAASTSPGIEAAYLEFGDGNVTGSTGCNRLTGPATASGETITFGSIVTTKMYCDDTPALEAHVLKVLRGEVHFTVEAGRLALESSTPDSGLGLRAET